MKLEILILLTVACLARTNIKMYDGRTDGAMVPSKHPNLSLDEFLQGFVESVFEVSTKANVSESIVWEERYSSLRESFRLDALEVNSLLDHVLNEVSLIAL